MLLRSREMVVMLAFVLCALPEAATARDWFGFDRAEALTRVRKAIERTEKIAPIPDLQCKPNPSILRYCRADIGGGLSFGITETTDRDYKKFREGGSGLVHEIWSRIDLTTARDVELTMFDTLCTATVLALRPRLSPAAAFDRYNAALRRSVNKSKSADSTEIVVGNPDTLIVESSSVTITCTLSAEDDYRTSD